MLVVASRAGVFSCQSEMHQPGLPPTESTQAARPCAENSADAATQIEATCQLIAAGRLAAHQLALHAKAYGLSEAEFRLLWLLRNSSHTTKADNLLDQKSLSDRLGLSPAQVSAVVERLRKKNLIEGFASLTDRRRQVWQLSAEGTVLVEKSISTFSTNAGNSPAPSQQEDAA